VKIFGFVIRNNCELAKSWHIQWLRILICTKHLISCANRSLIWCQSWHRCQAFCHTLSKPSYCYFRTVYGDLVTLGSKYTEVGYYYFSAWLIFHIVVMAMMYFAPHSAASYRVAFRGHVNVVGKKNESVRKRKL
jgi:hypothetical protein